MLAVFFVLQLDLELTALFLMPKLLSLLMSQLCSKVYLFVNEKCLEMCHSVVVVCCETITETFCGSCWVSLFCFDFNSLFFGVLSDFGPSFCCLVCYVVF